MKTRILVAVVAVPVLFVIMFFLKPVFLAVLTALICAVAAYEFMHAVAGNVKAGVKYCTAGCALIIPFCTLTGKPVMLIPFIAAALLIALFAQTIWSYRGEEPIRFEYIAYGVFAGVIYPLMMSSLVTLKSLENGKFFVLLPVVVTFCCDSGAYFTGMSIGKRKILPHISPNKSLEGFIGGLVAGTLCAILYGGIVMLTTEIHVNMFSIIVSGILGSIAVEIGDLAFSVIKRQHGVKDYGKLIPGHGGMLDRFDSMSFAAPIICGVMMILPAFTVI